MLFYKSQILRPNQENCVVSHVHTRKTTIFTISPGFCTIYGLAATVFTHSECTLLIDDNSQTEKCDEVLFTA